MPVLSLKSIIFSLLLLQNLGLKAETAPKPNNENLSPLENAILNDNLYEAEKLIDQGENLDAPKDPIFQRPSPLHLAIMMNNIFIIQKLLSKGANPNWSSEKFPPPLHWAVFQNQVAAARVLLKGGADPHKKLKGATPLMLAKDAQFKEMVSLLEEFDKQKNALKTDSKKNKTQKIKKK